MRRKAGGAIGPGRGGAARDGADAEADGLLEIEFEDDDAPPAPAAPAGRSRDLRPVTLTSLVAAVLIAALWATHAAAPGAGTGSGNSASLQAAPPNYANYVVTVSYQRSRLLSLAQRRIEIDLRVTPIPEAKVSIIDYYVSENGVRARADPPPSMTPLPAGGTDVKLDLTVTDCAAVAIGESMAFVDVVANGPAGTMDRFTILGSRYSADLARLLVTVCPGRTSGQSTASGATPVVVAGS